MPTNGLTAFNDESQLLIDTVREELRNIQSVNAPFDIFVLNGKVMFGEEHLLDAIPR